MPLGMEVGLGPGHVMLDGDPAPPPPEKGTATPPLFIPGLLWPNGCCIRIPFGTEIGLGPGDIALDGDPAPPMERSTAALHFSAHVYCS